MDKEKAGRWGCRKIAIILLTVNLYDVEPNKINVLSVVAGLRPAPTETFSTAPRLPILDSMP